METLHWSDLNSSFQDNLWFLQLWQITQVGKYWIIIQVRCLKSVLIYSIHYT